MTSQYRSTSAAGMRVIEVSITIGPPFLRARMSGGSCADGRLDRHFRLRIRERR